MKRFLLMAIAALVVGSTNAQDIHKKNAANAKNAHRIEMQTSKSNKFEIAGAKAGVKAIDSNKKMNAKNAVKAKNIKPIAQPFATAARVAAVQQTYKGYGTVRSSKESTNWDKVGFYKYHPEGYILPSYVAWISVQNVPQAKLAMVFDGDYDLPDTNGINDIAEQEVGPSTPVYNLSGQRVGNNYRGLIIKNGRKYIAK